MDYSLWVKLAFYLRIILHFILPSEGDTRPSKLWKIDSGGELQSNWWIRPQQFLLSDFLGSGTGNLHPSSNLFISSHPHGLTYFIIILIDHSTKHFSRIPAALSLTSRFWCSWNRSRINGMPEQDTAFITQSPPLVSIVPSTIESKHPKAN